MTTTSLSSPEPAVAGLLVTLDLPTRRVVVTGELDRATCRHLTAACPALAAAAAPAWVLDVTGLTFCDASGLRALADVRRAAADAGATVVVIGARPFVRGVLTLAGLGDVLTPVARTTPAPAGRRTGRTPAAPAAAPDGSAARPARPPRTGALPGGRHASGRA
ncbi:STAS domain-containing protein [Geodermatophilus sp. SYSU D00710]